MNWKRIWWIALVVKLVLACAIPLSNDEAYYWVWGQIPQLSYYDHPPFIAWLFYLARPLEGIREMFPNLGGIVRWPAVLMGHATLLVLLKIVGPSISERQKNLVLGVLLLSPFFGIGSLIATPDIPYVFFWCVSLLAFKRTLESPSVKNSLFLGAALGLGFCAKYLIVIFVPVGILYVLVHRRWDLFKPTNLLATVFAGLLFCAPVLLWNAQNDWVSFRFQLGHGLDVEALTWDRKLQQFLDYIGGQAGLLGLFVFVAGFGTKLAKENRLLIWMGWGPILFFAWTSLRSPVEANWPITGHLALLTAAAIISGRELQKARIAKGMMALWVAATVVVLYQSTRPELPLFGVEADRLKTYEFVRYRALETRARGATEELPIFASSYQMAGALSFATHRVVPKLAGINRVDFFDFHPSGKPITNQFEIALEHDWPWPSWIAELGYVEVSKESYDRFSIVRFQRRP